MPLPSGKYRVGTSIFEITDKSRTDLLDPLVHRTLVGQLWYPTLQLHGERASYIDPRLLIYLKENTFNGLAPTTLDHLQSIEPQAILNVQILPKKLPIIVFIHGLGSPRALHTILCEDLASHGYAVLALDHPYGGATVTAKGEFVSSQMDTLTSYEGDDILVPMRQWSQDVRYVLDELADPGSTLYPLHNGHIDFTNIAIAGHSIGGNIALGMEKYVRFVKGAINLDGGSFQNLEEEGIGVKSLVLRSYPIYSDEELESRGRTREAWNEMGQFIDSIFTRVYAGASEQVTSVQIKGTGHFSYSDAPYCWSPLVTQFGGKILDKDTTRMIYHSYILNFLEAIFEGHSDSLTVPHSKHIISRVYNSQLQ